MPRTSTGMTTLGNRNRSSNARPRDQRPANAHEENTAADKEKPRPMRGGAERSFSRGGELLDLSWRRETHLAILH